MTLDEIAAREAVAPLLGECRIPGETHVLEFRRDWSYPWGPTVTGSYRMLAATRVRMTLIENGKQVGRLDQDVAIDGSELRITTPDGAVPKFERVE